jgi:hypothetical protein
MTRFTLAGSFKAVGPMSISAGIQQVEEANVSADVSTQDISGLICAR